MKQTVRSQGRRQSIGVEGRHVSILLNKELYKLQAKRKTGKKALSFELTILNLILKEEKAWGLLCSNKSLTKLVFQCVPLIYII